MVCGWLEGDIVNGRNKVRLVNKNNMKLYYYLQRSSKTWYLR